jgi:hypothetical protein
LQEYDIEITPAKIVRGQGLCKLVADLAVGKQEENDMLNPGQHYQNQICCAQNPVSP